MSRIKTNIPTCWATSLDFEAQWAGEGWIPPRKKKMCPPSNMGIGSRFKIPKLMLSKAVKKSD